MKFKNYPDQYVALINVEPDIYNIKSADVIYSEMGNDISHTKSASELPMALEEALENGIFK